MGPNEPDEILRGAFGDLFEGESTLPPEEVWQNVRAAVVVAEKKRRGIFFWLIPAVLLFGAGSAFLLLSGGKEHPRQQSDAAVSTGRDPSTSERGLSTTENTSTSTAVKMDRPRPVPATIPYAPPGPVSYAPIQPRFASAITVGVAVTAMHDDLTGLTLDNEPEQALKMRSLPWPSPEPVTERTFLPKTPEFFFPRWVVGIETGFGTNMRTITGEYNETYNSNQLVSRDISLNNRSFALTGGYRFNRYVSVHTGISTGVNTYRSNWYLRMLTAQDAGSSYTFQTSEGSVKMSSEDVDGYFSESDTALFRMRLHHSSRYYSIPLSMKLTLPGTRLSGYVRLGGSWDLHTSGRTKALLKYGNFWSGWMDETKTVDLESSERTKLRSVQALIGMGLETHRDAPLQFFVEPQMSIPLTPVYHNAGMKVTSQYMQVRAGMTFFLPLHPTKSSVRTSW